jgi:cytochrome c oxidase assembly factor CtaG
VRIEAVLTTLSFVLLLAGLIWSPILGPDYSRRRFAMIYANLAVVAVVCLASLLGSRRYKLPLSLASCIVALEWIYLAVVNSVV